MLALLLHLLVQAVGYSRCGWLVDDPQDVQASYCACVFGGLSLRVVEVGGYCDDGVGDLLTQVGFGHLFHLDEDHGGDLFGAEAFLLAFELHLDFWLVSVVDYLERPVLYVPLDGLVVEFTADEAFGVEDSVFRVHGDLGDVIGIIS